MKGGSARGDDSDLYEALGLRRLTRKSKTALEASRK
jgi:hypothetical protein